MSKKLPPLPEAVREELTIRFLCQPIPVWKDGKIEMRYLKSEVEQALKKEE